MKRLWHRCLITSSQRLSSSHPVRPWERGWHFDKAQLARFYGKVHLPRSGAQIISRARSLSARFFFFWRQRRARERGPTTGTGNDKRRILRKSTGNGKLISNIPILPSLLSSRTCHNKATLAGLHCGQASCMRVRHLCSVITHFSSHQTFNTSYACLSCLRLR